MGQSSSYRVWGLGFKCLTDLHDMLKGIPVPAAVYGSLLGSIVPTHELKVRSNLKLLSHLRTIEV